MNNYNVIDCNLSVPDVWLFLATINNSVPSSGYICIRHLHEKLLFYPAFSIFTCDFVYNLYTVHFVVSGPAACHMSRSAQDTCYERQNKRLRKKWRSEVFSNLRGASGSVVHSRGASFLLHKDSFPLLPAARRLGQLSLCCLLSCSGLG